MGLLIDLKLPQNNSFLSKSYRYQLYRNLLPAQLIVSGQLFITLKLKKMLEECKAIQVISESLFILSHCYVLDPNRELVFSGSLRKYKSEIADNKLFHIPMLDGGAACPHLVADLTQIVVSDVAEPFKRH